MLSYRVINELQITSNNNVKNTKRIVRIVGISSLLLIFILASVFSNVHLKDTNKRKRKLRIFDPIHSNCGENEFQHWFAIHCIYGASTNIFPDYYIDKKTVTTDENLNYENRNELEQHVRVLATVAARTNRAIRIKIPVQLSYWGEYFVDDISEEKQPYTIINAGELHKVGADVVESNYWIKADAWRNIRKKPRHTLRNIQLSTNGTNSAITYFRKILEREYDDDTDEWVFSIEDLKLLNTQEIGRIAGIEGGFSNGWIKNFVCSSLPDPVEKNGVTLDEKVF